MKKDLENENLNEYEFNLENFTGPLDLLLHLAKSKEIEISDLSLDDLITQYILYIESVQDQGLNIASEYLEMAAELIRLKSQMLLPNTVDNEELLEELEELGLDREALIAKLLEYKKYKEICNDFTTLNEKRSSFFTRDPDKMIEYRDSSFMNSSSIDDFYTATKNYMHQELENQKEVRIIETDEIGSDIFLEEFRIGIFEFEFKDKIKGLSKKSMIALFLAILEALKLQYISFEFRNNQLYIKPYDEDALKENYE